jgi:hypothetical protein
MMMIVPAPDDARETFQDEPDPDGRQDEAHDVILRDWTERDAIGQHPENEADDYGE